MTTRIIKRLSDSAEIHVEQPGDKRCPVVGTKDRVLVRADGSRLDGLFCNPYTAYKMLRDREAVVLEED